MTVKDLKILFDYGYWVNNRLLDVLSQLTPEQFTQPVVGNYGSIRNTMVHMLSAEWGTRDASRVTDPMRSDDEWADAHAAFHWALVEGADSPWLLRIHSQLYAQSERYRRLSVPLSTEDRNVGQEHQSIMEAALKRDAERAVTLLTRHLAVTTEILLGADIENYAARRAAGEDQEVDRRDE